MSSLVCQQCSQVPKQGFQARGFQRRFAFFPGRCPGESSRALCLPCLGTFANLAGNLAWEPALGNFAHFWEPLPRNLCEPFLGTCFRNLLGKFALRNLFLGTLLANLLLGLPGKLCELCLGTLLANLGTWLGNQASEACLKTLLVGNLLGKLSWEPCLLGGYFLGTCKPFAMGL